MNSHPPSVSAPLASPRKAEAGPPLSWIFESIRLFRAHWGVVLSAYLVVLVVTLLLQVGVVTLMTGAGFAVTAVAGIVVFVVSCLLNAGVLAVFHGVAERRPRFSDVVSGFNGHTLLHIVLMLVMMILMAVAVAGIVYLVTDFSAVSGQAFGPAGFEHWMDGGPGARNGGMALGLSIIVGLILLALFAALFSFVIPLIVISRQGVMRAMANSLRASIRNVLVLLFFGINAIVFMQLLFIPVFAIGAASTSMIVMGVLAFITSIVWGAVLGGAYYLSFRDIFLEAVSSETRATDEQPLPA